MTDPWTQTSDLCHAGLDRHRRLHVRRLVGPFYPPGTRPQRMLAYYCRHFPLVELNFTFYRLQRLAEPAPLGYQPLAPHCTASYLGIAASLHVAASVPFILIHEFYPDNHGFNPEGIGRMPWQLDRDGYIGLPPGPGVEIDEKLLAKRSKEPQSYRWPGARLRDGSVAGY